jgi:hypothetical protein
LETTGAQADEYLSIATLVEQLESYQAVLFTDDVPHLERTLMQFDRPQRCTVMLVLSLDKSLEKAQNLLLAGADAVLNHGFSSQDLKRTLEDVHRARALLRIPELERGKNPSAVSEKID